MRRIGFANSRIGQGVCAQRKGLPIKKWLWMMRIFNSWELVMAGDSLLPGAKSIIIVLQRVSL